MYALRTASCQSCHISSRLTESDNALKDGLSSLLNVHLSEDQCNQASLPVRDAGLGIRSAASLATSAFSASAARTNDLQSLILPHAVSMIHEEVVEKTLQTWVVQSGASMPENDEACCQKAWDSKCIKRRKIF